MKPRKNSPKKYPPRKSPTSPVNPPATELLAPAGSVESFFAAMEAGADAVYCGLTEFSARAKAKNFSLEEMENLTAYAHQNNRRLYVTINTLIKEAELPRLIEILTGLANCRVDGLIIQDLGLWRLARHYFPKTDLHASTQMAIHNAAGVKMLEQMGFKRAVLARELSLDEISAIRQQTHIELEQFIHGALCYSISGHCFFSSYLSGKSGNRGRCAQPCRRRYQHRDTSGFYFSTSDLCAIEMIPRLIAAGVMSFKIEGRMKNAEYVATVVSAYRKVLDAGTKERHRAVTEAQEMLAQSFGRTSTTGFLKGRITADIALASREGGIGRQLGQVKKVSNSIVFFTTDDTIHVGDRLRIQPNNDQVGTSFTIKELFVAQQQRKKAEPGSFVHIPTPFSDRFHSGDTVYKVAAGKIFTISEEACRRRLTAATPIPFDFRLTVSCMENSLFLEAQTTDTTLAKQYQTEMMAASHSPLNHATLLKVFQQTGHAALRLESLTVKDLLPVVIPPSRLKEIRRDFFEQLIHLVTSSSAEKTSQRILFAQQSLLPPGRPSPSTNAHLTIRIKNSKDFQFFNTAEVHEILLPLTPENVTAFHKEQRQFEKKQQQITWDIPAIIYEAEWQSFQNVISQLQKNNCHFFRLNNPAHFQFFKNTATARLTAGPLLYVLNSSAALTLKELGAKSFTLSLEDDKKNMADVLSRETGIPAVTIVYSPIAVLTSRIPMRLRGLQPVLESEKGETLQLDFSTGLTVVYGGNDFSLLGRLNELYAIGCENFMLDLSRPGVLTRQYQSIMTAFHNNRTLQDTTPVNFDRGLE